MKRSFVWIGLVVLIGMTWSCGSDSSTPAPSNLSTKPEALAAENGKSGGIYKGAVVGSSGVITVRLQNGVKEIVITIDGTSKTLTTTALDAWVSGDLIKNAVFLSADGWQATFSVTATGGNPSVLLSIPGHSNVVAAMFKELSTALVRVYEGTYSGTASGTWNFAIQGPALIGVYRSADNQTTGSIYGIVDSSTISLDSPSGTGTLSGNSASGSWQTSSPGGAGTWTGNRIL